MSESTNKSGSKKAFIVAGAVALLVAAFGAAYAMRTSPGELRAASQLKAAPAAGKVAAIVNGEEIFDAELNGALAQGVDRAVAVDRYVNKVLAAELARKAFSQDAREALKGAEREVLSQLYIAKRTSGLREALTDAEVAEFYNSKVKADDYATYKVRFAMSADEKDVGELAAAIATGKAKDVDARFKPAKDGDNFVLAAELPYGLGNLVRGLKKGEYSRPVVLRNGFYILHIEDIKSNPKPELAKLSDEIKNVLVAQKLSDELTAARTAAKVELR